MLNVHSGNHKSYQEREKGERRGYGGAGGGDGEVLLNVLRYQLTY